MFLRSLGGAYGDVAADATAFAGARRDVVRDGRRVRHPRPGRRRRARETGGSGTRSRCTAIGVYGNFTPSIDPSLPGRMYPPETMARLARGEGHAGIRATCSHAITTSPRCDRPPARRAGGAAGGLSACLRPRSRCGRPTTGCGRCRPCRPACRCARRRSRAGPGSARPAAARSAARRSRTATTANAGGRDAGLRRRRRRPAATNPAPRSIASVKYGASSSDAGSSGGRPS